MITKLWIALAGLALAMAVEAAEYVLPAEGDIVGTIEVIEARHEDTFVALARRYNVGFEALRQANPEVDEWLPGEGTKIVIPSQYVLPDAERTGVVINLPELRLYYYPRGTNRVITHPISIGRMDWGTPLGRTSVVAKSVRPSWYPPQSIRDEHAALNDPLPAVVPPGPDNPLGEYALRLGIPGYLIHGTNKPSGVGMRVTHGCIRMFPEDIEAMFRMVDQGTSVRIVNQPFKLGWGEGGLYMEAHPPLGEERADETWTATELTRLYVAATGQRRVAVDWHRAESVMLAGQGVPEFVTVAGAVIEPVVDETTAASQAAVGPTATLAQAILPISE